MAPAPSARVIARPALSAAGNESEGSESDARTESAARGAGRSGTSGPVAGRPARRFRYAISKAVRRRVNPNSCSASTTKPWASTQSARGTSVPVSSSFQAVISYWLAGTQSPVAESTSALSTTTVRIE